VALKVLRPDRLDPTSRARFDAERRLLALLDHPSLVKVFDAGETPDGRPWFTMELAQGAPITEAADAARLGVDERLRLLAQVARAVHHAHAHGLVHRDLKPANILLAVEGDALRVKVIDFGVAHAVFAPVDPDQQAGTLVGTPDYLPPELSRLHTVAPEVRSDVFALGVVMRRLLSGNDPSDRRAVPSASLQLLDAAHRRTAAAERRETAPSLRRRLEGDVDAIAARCLADDPRDRYATALELAQDIDRHLKGEAVHARGDSLAYHGFVAARQQARTIAVAGMIVLVAFTGFLWANHERHIALAARDRAEASAHEARAANAFVLALLTRVAITRDASQRETLAVLDDARDLASAEFGGQPVQEGRVRYALAGLYQHLGAHDRAIEELERAEKLLGPDGMHEMSARIRADLATSFANANRLEDARRAAMQGLELALREVPEDSDDVAEASAQAADILLRQGNLADAEAMLDRASDALDRAPADPGDVRARVERIRAELQRARGRNPATAP
jgi:tetratricopeptide (TPR) repeat protein